jgi:hypothetical protein
MHKGIEPYSGFLTCFYGNQILFLAFDEVYKYLLKRNHKGTIYRVYSRRVEDLQIKSTNVTAK